jgi:hypothetical protein
LEGKPTHPVLISILPYPAPSLGRHTGTSRKKADGRARTTPTFCSTIPTWRNRGDVFYLTYFNAGLRIFDVASPRLPREIGCFIPPDPIKRYGPQPEGRLALQTEDVLVDRRGYIYLTHKNQGLWIVRHTG